MTDHDRIELATQFECLAQDSAVRGARVEALYTKLRNDPHMCEALLRHVARQMIENDKVTIGLRSAAKLVRDTMSYEGQLPSVLDQLERSFQIVAPKVLDFKRSAVDRVGYLGIQGEDSAS